MAEQVVSVDAFVWECGSAVISLVWEESSWMVRMERPSRLLGSPRTMMHQQSHLDPRFAAFDVHARVVLVSGDDEEGVRAGCAAARWLRARTVTLNGYTPPPVSPQEA